MEDKILQLAKFIANKDLSGTADLTWHEICVEILKTGLNQNNLREFAISDGEHRLAELCNGEIHMMATYLMNFLSTDSYNISYCAEIKYMVQDFVKNYK